MLVSRRVYFTSNRWCISSINCSYQSKMRWQGFRLCHVWSSQPCWVSISMTTCNTPRSGTKGIYCNIISTNHPIHIPIIPHTISLSLHFTYMHLCKNTPKFCRKKMPTSQHLHLHPVPDRLWSSSPWRLRQSPNLLRRGDCLPPEGRWFSCSFPFPHFPGWSIRKWFVGFPLGFLRKTTVEKPTKGSTLQWIPGRKENCCMCS